MPSTPSGGNDFGELKPLESNGFGILKSGFDNTSAFRQQRSSACSEAELLSGCDPEQKTGRIALDNEFEKSDFLRRISIEKSYSWCCNVIEKSKKR